MFEGTTGIMHETLLYLTRCMGLCILTPAEPFAQLPQAMYPSSDSAWQLQLDIAVATMTSFPLLA